MDGRGYDRGVKSSGDYQPTPLTRAAPAAGGPAPAEPVVASGRRPKLPAGIARRTGVVFVHGIGTQGPAETFLDWSAPIVSLLTDWRRARDFAPGGPLPAGRQNSIADPVSRGAFAFNAASPPFLELSIPESVGVPATAWVVTEAWWAAQLRPPDLGRTIDYLRRRLRTIVAGIASGYRARSASLIDTLADRGLIDRERPPLSWRAMDWLDRSQARIFGARLVAWTIGGAGVALLIGYDLLRRVPIGPVREFAARRMVDSFLVEWFGDLPVLIDEPVQAANVRARLAERIAELREVQHCDAVVVVAHSGGALVTFATLLDPVYLDDRHRVDKLITLGQGLGLAWRLAADPGVTEIAPGHRLVGNLAAVRPELSWVDFWATYDPAPAGPLPARGGLVARDETPDGQPAAPSKTAAAVETGEGRDAQPWLVRSDVGTSASTELDLARRAGIGPGDPVINVESRPVTNEMNVLTDHGGYWANEEGFLVPLVRHIDAAVGAASASRFYRDPAARGQRILWRRQRVSALAAWDWLCAVGAVASIGMLLLVGWFGGDDRLAAAGEGLAAAWSVIPGEEIVSGTINGIGGLIGAIAGSVGLGAAASLIEQHASAVLAILFIVGLFFALAKVGNWRWHDWDRRERTLMRPEAPLVPDRRRAGAQAIALLGGFACLQLAVLDVDRSVIAATWIAAATGGLIAWLWSWLPRGRQVRTTAEAPDPTDPRAAD